MLLLAAGLLAQAPRFAVADAGVQLPPAEHFFACGDFDNDRDPDLLVDGRRLYRNDSEPGALRFVDVTGPSGLEAAKGPSGCWFDFDLDGRLDFATQSGELWLQAKAGHFVEAGGRLGLVLPHGAAAAIAAVDLDGDGYADLFGGGDNVYDPLTHFLQSAWQNPGRGKGKLVDLTAQLGGRLAYGRAVLACDFDQDGDDDVYTGNYHLDANCLWRNDGGKLVDVAKELGIAGCCDGEMFTIPQNGQKIGFQYGHTIGAAWADLDGDGWFDLVVANLAHKYVGPVSAEFAKVIGSDIDVRGYVCEDSGIYLNQGPPSFHFVERRAAMGIPVLPIGGKGEYRGDELWSNAVCGDFDNNGSVDLWVNQVYGNLPYSFGLLFANAGGRFTDVHEAAGVKYWGGYGGAAADFDSDGRLDLVVSGADKPGGAALVRVLRNESAAADWLGLRLVPRSGQQLLGAKVLLLQTDGVQVRQVASTMGSHSQQGEARVHFGLGASAVRDVVVYWPDGRMQSLGPLAKGRYHEVVRTAAAKLVVKLKAPAVAKVGEAVTFAVVGEEQGRKGCRYEWDFGGSRMPEVVGGAGSVEHAFTQPGPAVAWVRVVRPGGVCGEARAVVEVKAE